MRCDFIINVDETTENHAVSVREQEYKMNQ